MPDDVEENESEFVKLLVGHQSLIRAFVISQLPGLPEAEDVIQKTSEVLWTKRSTFKLGTNFKAWALTTARFQVMAQQQKLKSSRRAPLDDDVLEMVAKQAEEFDSSSLDRRLEDLNQCISQLQVRDQELVLHRYWKNSGLAEYARASGRSVGALKVALYRLRESLRVCMDKKIALRGGRV